MRIHALIPGPPAMSRARSGSPLCILASETATAAGAGVRGGGGGGGGGGRLECGGVDVCGVEDVAVAGGGVGHGPAQVPMQPLTHTLPQA